MKRLLVCLAAGLVLAAAGALPADEPPAPKLLIAFSSYRERPKHPNTFFYEHEGVAAGKVVSSVATPRPTASAEGHPSLSHDGRWCAFPYEVENMTGRV